MPAVVQTMFLQPTNEIKFELKSEPFSKLNVEKKHMKMNPVFKEKVNQKAEIQAPEEEPKKATQQIQKFADSFKIVKTFRT